MIDRHSRRRARASPISSAVEQLHGYDVRRPLGHGRAATVWEATCPRSGRVVALRHEHTCRACDQPPAAVIDRARHPYLVDVYAEGPGVAALELARGGTIAEWIAARRRAGASRASIVAWVARAGAQVASALAFLHDAGQVHRDVKPDNILVVPGPSRGGEMTIRLADFDLLQARAARFEEAVIAGTPAFMAPEQHRAEEVDERADLFALGATLLSLLTAGPPFAGVDENSLLAAKLSRRPQLPLRPTSAEVHLIEQLLPLLEPAAGSRTTDAATACGRLAAMCVGDPPVAGCQRIVHRDRERAQLVELLERALRGRSGSAVITGPPGSGRTALLEEVELYARARGFTVARKGKRARPDGGVVTMVDDIERLGHEQTSALLDAAGALTLRQDDSLGASPLLLLTCDSSGPDRPWLVSRIASLATAGTLHVALEPLDLEATAEFVSACVADPGRRGQPSVTELHEASGGLPALLVALSHGDVALTGGLSGSLLRLSTEELEHLQMLALCPSGWSQGSAPLVPEVVASLCARRLLRRDGRGRVRLAAFALGEAALAALSSTSRRTLAARLLATLPARARSRRALDLAIEAGDVGRVVAATGAVVGALRIRGDWSGLAPLLERIAAVDGLPVPARVDAMCGRAEALLASGALERAAQVAADAVAGGEAGDDPQLLARALRVAIDVATSAYDEGTARAASERLLAIARAAGRPADESRALIALGRAGEALVVARRAGQPELVAASRLACAREAQRASDGRRAAVEYEAAAAAYGALGDSRQESSCYLGLGRIAFGDGRHEVAERWWRRALDVAGPGAPRSHLLTLEFNLGVTLQLAEDFDEAGRVLREVLARCVAGGDHRRTVNALTALMNVESQRFDLDAAVGIGNRALDLAARLGDHRLEALVHANLGDIARIVGDDDVAEQHCVEAVRLARAVGDVEPLAVALRNRAELLLRRAVVFPRWRGLALSLLETASAELRDASESEIALEVELDLLVLGRPTSTTAEQRIGWLIEQAHARRYFDLERKARNASVRRWIRIGDRERARAEARNATEHAVDEPLSEASLFAAGLAATLEVGEESYRRLTETVEKMLQRLGAGNRVKYLARNDVAEAIYQALELAHERDPTAARDLSDALTHNPAFGWRADILIARSAEVSGRHGVAMFRWSRARKILEDNPELALEARLDDSCRSLLKSLESSPAARG